MGFRLIEFIIKCILLKVNCILHNNNLIASLIKFVQNVSADIKPAIMHIKISLAWEKVVRSQIK